MDELRTIFIKDVENLSPENYGKILTGGYVHQGTSTMKDDYWYFALAVVKGFYDAIMATAGEDARTSVKNKALAHAKYLAAQHMQEIKGLADRSFLYLIESSKVDGWSTYFEWDDVGEILQNIFDDTEEQSTEFYDWKCITQDILPVAKQLGINPAAIVGASAQMRKIRRIVPDARQVINNFRDGSISEERAAAELSDMIGQAANTSITYDKLNANLNEKRGKVAPPPMKVKGFEVYLPAGHWIILVPQNEVEANAVKHQVRDLGEISLMNYKQMYDLLISSGEKDA